MQVDRLRLVGFKSFVEAAELEIRPGLTGIVGPNGCGKSNLAEALRWAMGESSARRLRGGEMDDLIFAGSAGRPGRNIAEVALTLDNGARNAPRGFNDSATIEVVRRIERGGGSVFRINGREARARDVQLLFADAGTGGHFGTVIGQGQVGALIEAKPTERRQLLEEAAGTAGHQLRRREALSRLAAAESNLARLDDVIATLVAQFEAVKRQARQAQRYRRLAEQIRQSEVRLFRARRRVAESAATQAAAELAVAETAVAERTQRSAAGREARMTAEAALPPLRVSDSAASAELQHLIGARAGLERELQRVVVLRSEAERRQAQLIADLQREDGQLADANAALVRLSAVRDRLTDAGPREREPYAAAGRLAGLAQLLAAAEAELQQATLADAQAAARRAAVERRRRDLDEHGRRIEARRAEIVREHAAIAGDAVPEAAAKTAAAAVAEAERAAGNAAAEVDAAEREVAARQSCESAALEALQQIAAQRTRLAVEADALRAVLAPAPAAGGGVPIMAALRVRAGFEAALGALFDDDELTAAIGAAAGALCYWRELPPVAGAAVLPEDVLPLAEVVAAPPALGRRLALSGWVEDAETGSRLQPRLLAGQRLVDRDGRLWRWDGFTRDAPSGSAAARRIEQQQRLEALAEEIARTETRLRPAEAAAAATRVDRERAAADLRLARSQRREAEAALAAARSAEAALARRAVGVESRLAALDEMAARLAAEITETTAAAVENERELRSLPAPEVLHGALEERRNTATAARRSEADARAEIDRVTRERKARRERLSAIELEERAWRKRADGAAAQQAVLAERRNELQRELDEVAARPAAIAAESEALGGRVAAAAAAAGGAAAALAAGEARRREAVAGADAVDRSLAEARELRAKLEVQHDGAGEALMRLDHDAAERLGTTPEGLAELAGDDTDDAAAAGDPAEIAGRLDRLRRERDGIGPVNLVAISEAVEIEARIEGLRREHAELTEAIAKLHRGIATLDREARQRLTDAFERVGQHFTELFVRLFGGGRARLELTEEADGRGAGLEIMASPTGKRLQRLSLLSGGEQALTALALIFAVFLTNPAPVCVLDEVDAPLDDANVERLCRLVADIAETAGTRFLVVTHHRITMARADRLYGVTMIEPGVSRLVSVELEAARLRQTA